MKFEVNVPQQFPNFDFEAFLKDYETNQFIGFLQAFLKAKDFEFFSPFRLSLALFQASCLLIRELRYLVIVKNKKALKLS